MREIPDLGRMHTALAAINLAGITSSRAKVLLYEVELITPMMGGGVTAGIPDTGLPFRTRSLRGQLRMWWRILRRGEEQESPDIDRKPTSKDWQALEQSIWGGIPADKNTKPQASAVGLRIEKHASVSPLPYSRLIDTKDLAYAYFSAKANGTVVPEKHLVPANVKFRLTVVLTDPTLEEEIHDCICYWATFGGIGARTSRGAGAVCVHRIDKVGSKTLLCVLTDSKLNHLLRPQSTTSSRHFSDLGGLLRISVLCSNSRARRTNQFADAKTAHSFAIGKINAFRQGAYLARDAEEVIESNGQRRTKPGLSRWPEPHGVRVATGTNLPGHSPDPQFLGLGSAPRASFGLPIVLAFKRTDGPGDGVARDIRGRDPLTRSLLPPDDANGTVRDRMASPLVLRPVAAPGGKFYSVAVLINRNLLEGKPPDEPRIQSVRLDKKAGTVESMPVSIDHLHESLACFREGQAFPQAKDAVEMFMNYLLSDTQ
jgi:CRISPR-associated protein Cmr1